MHTHLLDATELDIAITLLQQQNIVVLPTETVYGLAADATSNRACEAVFRAKCRPPDNPLIVHCVDADMAALYMKKDDAISQRAAHDAFAILLACSPGPVSVIVYATDDICHTARAGGVTVALRVPSHPLFARIIQRVGVSLAAPSANRSGEPSPTDALMAWESMNTKVPAIVDGGACTVGLESTIVNCTITPPQIVRPGVLSAVTISQKSGVHVADIATSYPLCKGTQSNILNNSPVTVVPGSAYRHYAPQATIIPMVNILHATKYFSGVPHCTYNDEKGIYSAITHALNISGAYKHKDIAIIVVGDTPMSDNDTLVSSCGLYSHKGTWQLLEPALYALFAEIDRRQLKVVFITCPTADEHHALYNRITRAAMA